MKAIAIVELPNDAFDDEVWGNGKWMIDDMGIIRYKEDDAWMYYKDIDVDGIELRPFPTAVKDDMGSIYLNNIYSLGWNACIKAITGETE